MFRTTRRRKSLTVMEKLEERAMLAVVAVSPDLPWVDTGIDVVAGESIRISTHGQIYSQLDDVGLRPDGSVALEQARRINESISIAADGTSSCGTLGLPPSTEHPDTVCMSLVGKLGGAADDVLGTPLIDADDATEDGFVGSEYDGQAPVAGRLFLGVNNPLWRDSNALTGSFEASVQTGPTNVEDLAADWNDAQNPYLNWSFNAGNAALNEIVDWSLAGQTAWTAGGANPEASGAPAWLQLDEFVPAGFEKGDVVVRPTAVGSGNGAANMTWTSPEAGVVALAGGLWTETATEDFAWTIDVNDQQLTSGTLLAGEYSRDKPADFRSGTGGLEGVRNLFVNAGDILRLTITSNASESQGYVGVDLSITSDLRGFPSYRLGEIPDQDATNGQPIQFRVDTPPETVEPISMQVVGSPQGPVSFYAETNVFSYTPSPDDRFDFSVFVQARNGGTIENPQSQLIKIRTNDIQDELELVSVPQSLPNAASDTYISVAEETVPIRSDSYFNAITGRETLRSVEISGKLVRFVPGDDGLFERFSYNPDSVAVVNSDIQELAIYAETVVIGGELHLPQTNVTIYAKELVFEDDGDRKGKSIPRPSATTLEHCSLTMDNTAEMQATSH